MLSRGRFGIGLLAVAAALLLSGGGCNLSSQFRPLTGDVVRGREYCRRGVAEMEQENWEAAEEQLRMAVKLNEEDSQTRQHYSEVLWQRGKHQESLVQLVEAARLSEGGDAALHVSLAEKLLQMRDPQRALKSTEHAIDLEPDHPKAWALRAECRGRLGQLDQALPDYYRALALDPENRLVHRHLADLQMALGRPNRALATWQGLERLYSPGNEPVEVLVGKGIAYMALARHVDAEKTYAQARKKDPYNAEICCRQAEAQLAAGEVSQAWKTVQEAMRLDPHFPASRRLSRQIEIARRSDTLLQ